MQALEIELKIVNCPSGERDSKLESGSCAVYALAESEGTFCKDRQLGEKERGRVYTCKVGGLNNDGCSGTGTVRVGRRDGGDMRAVRSKFVSEEGNNVRG